MPSRKQGLVNRQPTGTYKGKLINRASGAYGQGGTGEGERGAAKRFEGITPEMEEQFKASKKNNVQCDGQVTPIKDLKPDPLNARLHPDRNLVAIMQSLALFGQRKPVVVNKRTMIVVAGNGTIEAAQALGWTKLAATIRPMSDEDARDYGLADNKTAELARWDFEVVAQLDALREQGENARMVGWSFNELSVLRKEQVQTAEGLWTGMPEFVQEDLTAFKSVTMHFRNQEDYEDFLRLLGQTEKNNGQNSFWHPEAVEESYADKRYVNAHRQA